MKKLLIVTLTLLLVSSVVFAGGIVTNTNQSAEYVRTLNRNASTDVDAVYYNPAGLTKLQDGLHLYLSNQSIFQTRTINNDNPILQRNEYTASVNAPFFPNIYAAYKTNKLAISGGIAPVGGGGSADYKDGSPLFESQVASLVPMLTSAGVPGINGYQLDAQLLGSSVYIGGQIGVSYEVNEMLSVGLAGRYIMANNKYEGHLKDVMLVTDAGTMPPADYLDAVAQQLLTAAAQYRAQGQDAQADALEAQAQQLQGQATVLANATADKELNVKQTGSAFGAILSANISPNEDLNIGIRYETKKPLELKNDTKTDDVNMYPDGKTYNADIPAILAVGVSYNITPELRTEISGNYFFNEGVKWTKVAGNQVVKNDYEAGIAFEYQVMPELRASVGYLYSKSGAQKAYQSDLSYSLSSNTVAGGIGYRVMPNLDLNIGVLNTSYMNDTVTMEGAGNQTYKKSTLDFAIGASYALP